MATAMAQAPTRAAGRWLGGAARGSVFAILVKYPARTTAVVVLYLFTARGVFSHEK
jgi:hypothetical protein